MSITIRHAKLNDMQQLAFLFNAYRVFYRKEENIPGARSFLTDRINNKDAVIFVAEAGDTLAGFVQLYPTFSSTRMLPLWTLNDLFVSDKFRGFGISKLLIDASKAWAVKTKACGVQLETEKSNHIGNSLYPKTGFDMDTDHNFYFWENKSQ